MKQRIILAILLFSLISCEKSSSFKDLITLTNIDLDKYAKMTPSAYTYLPLKDFSFTEQKILDIERTSENEGVLSKNRDSISNNYLISYYRRNVINGIKNIISHSEFTNIDISSILKSEVLSIVKSDDGKLYNFSIDQKTGGSYQSRVSIMHFVNIDTENSPSQEAIIENEELDPYYVFRGDGFDKIYVIDTDEGTKYLLTGNVRECSSCFGNNIMLVSYANGSFTKEFQYNVSSRDSESGITYDANKNRIEVKYKLDDLTTECHCRNNVKPEKKENMLLEVEIQKPICICIFEFDGSNFVLNKQLGNIEEFIGNWAGPDNMPLIELMINSEGKFIVKECYGLTPLEGITYPANYEDGILTAVGNEKNFYKWTLPTFALIGENQNKINFNSGVGLVELVKTNTKLPNVKFNPPVNND